MAEALKELKEKLAIVEDLKGASSVLAWDQETYLPPGGVESRAAQLGTLERVIHEQFTSDEIGDLLHRAEASAASDRLSETDQALLRVVRHDYGRKTRLPVDLVSRMAETTARAMPAWAAARAESDFGAFRPYLEAIVDLNREKAEALGYDDDPYDALLDEFEPGMKTSEVASEFADLRRELIPIVDAIADRDEPSADLLHGPFDEKKQWDFGLAVIRDFGFDMERGRQDRSTHPFTIHFSSTDVRLTTRIESESFSPGFFGTLHEAGHGLYEQGIGAELARTPLAHGTSLGMHEAQSRLWENQIGRSRRFWEHYLPGLRSMFPERLEGIDVETFYRAINRVKPSLIRVEADEVTYNLHIMLRFELEQSLVKGDLAVADLPDAWNERMESYLGLTPPSDKLGVLQDIHWSMGALGYFPTYSLGTIMSAQIYDAASAALPGLEDDLGCGRFERLLDWLQQNIYRFGRIYHSQDILENVTGSKLDSSHWLAYIRGKFGGIYGALP